MNINDAEPVPATAATGGVEFEVESIVCSINTLWIYLRV